MIWKIIKEWTNQNRRLLVISHNILLISHGHNIPTTAIKIIDYNLLTSKFFQYKIVRKIWMHHSRNNLIWNDHMSDIEKVNPFY